MNKKQLRKDLELALVKNLEDLLISINPEAAKKVDEIIFGAAKIIAKKFYKSIKQKEEKKVEKKPVPAKKKAVKPLVKTAPKKTVKPSVNKSKTKK